MVTAETKTTATIMRIMYLNFPLPESIDITQNKEIQSIKPYDSTVRLWQYITNPKREGSTNLKLVFLASRGL